MKTNFYSLIIFFILAAAATNLNAQGCVAVKNMSSCSINWGDEEHSPEGLQIALNYRYFRSYKHFVGDHEEKHRVEQGTEVINNDNSINLGVSYTLNKRWSTSVIIPYIHIDRSSMYEHLGNSYPGQDPPNLFNPEFKRFHTQSHGLGDIRVIGYYNALGAYNKGVLTLGAGLKLPTGKKDVKDKFHKREGVVEAVVDQSMQLGDGAVGVIIEADFLHQISGPAFGYVQGMYMLSPANTNGVKRSPTLTTTPAGDEIAKSNEFSVPDQYMLRMGGRYMANGLQLSLGGRMECIPSKDLIGESQGFRRPGFIMSVEPSAFYTFGAHTVGFNFPVAVERNRTRSQIDIERGINPTTGAKYHGDAAFADWLLSLTYAYKLAN
jgi:hypothetical protein